MESSPGTISSAALCSTMEHQKLGMASKHRLSVNLSPKEHRELAALAENVRVSKAWLGRQAITEFLERYSEKGLHLPLNLSRTTRAGDKQ